MYDVSYNEDTGRYEVSTEFGTVISDYGRRADALRGIRRLMNR
jgi:hypothetical protein